MFKVAIIIPTLNEELYIASCLESIKAQTYPFDMMDIMVVDGGSKDKTREIVDDFSSSHSNVRLLDNPGRIQSIAFNIGVKNSDAPYVIRLDAHVSYEKHYIERCIKHLETMPEVGDVGGICETKVRRPGILSESIAVLCQSKFGIGGAAFRVGASAGYVDTVPFGAFPRNVINEVGGMREDLARAEDNEYVSRIRRAGYKVYLDPDIISTYYARDTFTGIIKQMYANGKSIGQLFYVDRSAIGLRHFVPLAFVLGLLFSFCGTFIWFPIFYLLLTVIGLYSIVNILATCLECKKHGWKYIVALPILFMSVHISYGVGTIFGLIKYMFRS